MSTVTQFGYVCSRTLQLVAARKTRATARVRCRATGTTSALPTIILSCYEMLGKLRSVASMISGVGSPLLPDVVREVRSGRFGWIDRGEYGVSACHVLHDANCQFLASA